MFHVAQKTLSLSPSPAGPGSTGKLFYGLSSVLQTCCHQCLDIAFRWDQAQRIRVFQETWKCVIFWCYLLVAVAEVQGQLVYFLEPWIPRQKFSPSGNILNSKNTEWLLRVRERGRDVF